MAVNKPVGDKARQGAVRKRAQLETKIMGEKRWSKGKFKGVRRER